MLFRMMKAPNQALKTSSQLITVFIPSSNNSGSFRLASKSRPSNIFVSNLTDNSRATFAGGNWSSTSSIAGTLLLHRASNIGLHTVPSDGCGRTINGHETGTARPSTVHSVWSVKPQRLRDGYGDGRCTVMYGRRYTFTAKLISIKLISIGPF
ncbi:hypothetical protein L208DRAFT_423657 [Tricholoma matsutake]|nr:hypothetical protein L208DRAFT_423657 [Tricholoma matsutake 945]